MRGSKANHLLLSSRRVFAPFQHFPYTAIKLELSFDVNKVIASGNAAISVSPWKSNMLESLNQIFQAQQCWSDAV